MPCRRSLATSTVLAALLAASCARREGAPIERAPEAVGDAAKARPLSSVAPGVAEPESATSVTVVTLAPPPSSDVKVLAHAAWVAMQAKDLRTLSAMVHPKWGIRFTPYTSVATTDVILTSAQLEGAMVDPTVRRWGSYDGSGEPIRTTFAGYWSRFVWDKDYAKPKPTFNRRTGGGLATDNTFEKYPGATVVEWYVDARPGWLDWGALRLVFAPEGKNWWLVGVIHDQWTI